MEIFLIESYDDSYSSKVSLDQMKESLRDSRPVNTLGAYEELFLIQSMSILYVFELGMSAGQIDALIL
jgi:hypothetical protein